MGKARRIALVAKTPADARDVMIEGESGILNISPPWFKPEYESSKRRITWPNGAIATVYSSKEPDHLNGPQHDLAWGDEIRTWYCAQETWDMLMFGLRLGEHPRVVATTTPLPIALIRNLLKAPDVVVTRGTTYENRANLAPSFFAQIVKKYEGTRIGEQEIKAELLDDVPGALWKRNMLNYRPAPDMVRVVVAIDPATTSKESSDETGIIVAGKGVDGLAYILADRSARISPDSWARRAVQALDDFKADKVIGEVNNGGDLVELTIRTVRKNISYKAVHASRGKFARAEPVAALYEQGKVFHTQPFTELEDQQCTWTPESGESPDRLDACFIAGTMIKTEIGDVEIERIKPGMKVWTRCGLCHVVTAGMTNLAATVITAQLSNGLSITGTPNHLIFTANRGFIPLHALVWGDIIETWKEKKSFSKVLRLVGIQIRRSGITEFISHLRQEAILISVCCMSKYGKMLMGLFPRDIWSTIKTATRSIMTLTTWNASLEMTMQSGIRGNAATVRDNTLTKSAHSPVNGTPRRKALSGIANTVKRPGKTERQSSVFVYNAGAVTNRRPTEIQTDSAQEHVFRNGMNLTSDITKTGNASPVEQHSTLRNLKSKQSAPVSVLGLSAAGKAPVYNLQVEDAPEYFANRVLVHNCVWALTELMLGEEEPKEAIIIYDSMREVDLRRL